MKYLLTAMALKAFSATSQTKSIYRLLGNRLFGRRMRTRGDLPQDYIDRAIVIIDLCKKYDILRGGEHVLEVGTGWVHWESVILRLFYDVEITLFDVWDNRQFGAFQFFTQRFAAVVDRAFDLDDAQRDRVHKLLDAIAATRSFDEAYTLLGFRYLVDQGGTLAQLGDEQFALVYSSNVLEHVQRDILAAAVRDYFRVLRPGGVSIHYIDPGDHLAYYTKNISYKNYLRYPDAIWRTFFENTVQYFNRVQRSEWLDLFADAGFEVIDECPSYIDIHAVPIARQYALLSPEDLACIGTQVVHRRPLLSTPAATASRSGSSMRRV